MKEVLSILILIHSAELLSFYTGIPFTILDLFLLPVSLLLIVMGIKSLIWGKPRIPKPTLKQTALQFSYFIVGLICTFLLGLWCLLTGWQAPVTLFSSVRGGAYGYTLVSMGLLMAGYSLFFVFILVARIKDR